MASVRVNMRIPGELWDEVSAYARGRDESNTAVVVGALRSFLGGVGRGVPKLEETPGPEARDVGTKPAALAASAAGGQQPSPASVSPRAPAVDGPREWARQRQEKLNAAKYKEKR